MADPNNTTRQGGLEPSPEEQDRPEQNEGYDEAVRGGMPDQPLPDVREWNPVPSADPDDREAADAAAEVRRREKSAGRQ